MKTLISLKIEIENIKLQLKALLYPEDQRLLQ